MPNTSSAKLSTAAVAPSDQPLADVLAVDPITHSPLHAGVDLRRYYLLHVMAAVFPLAMGLILYGWRALGVVGMVVGSSLLAGLLWQRIGTRGAQIRLLHVGWFALVLGLMLPPHLAARWDATAQHAPWMIPVASGWTLVMLMWTLGGVGAGRVSPILVGYLLLCVLYGNAFVANRVLQRDHLVTGDLMASAPDALRGTGEPWIWAQRASGGPADALFRENSAALLGSFTTGTEAADPRLWLSLDVLLRDRLPPLEDFIVGGEPGPIGAGCALGVIVGGLFLLYRGLIDYRIPLLILVFAYLTMLILPIPLVLTEEPQYHWLAVRHPSVSWQTALTFVHYELLAGPALFMALFLATWPSIRPIEHGARALYAALIGILTALFQLYASVSYGPYMALLIASLLTPWFDKWLRPKPLV